MHKVKGIVPVSLKSIKAWLRYKKNKYTKQNNAQTARSFTGAKGCAKKIKKRLPRKIFCVETIDLGRL